MNLEHIAEQPSRRLKFNPVGAIFLSNGESILSRFIEGLYDAVLHPVSDCMNFVCRQNPNSDRVVYSNAVGSHMELEDYRKPFVPTKTTVFV